MQFDSANMELFRLVLFDGVFMKDQRIQILDLLLRLGKGLVATCKQIQEKLSLYIRDIRLYLLVFDNAMSDLFRLEN